MEVLKGLVVDGLVVGIFVRGGFPLLDDLCFLCGEMLLDFWLAWVGGEEPEEDADSEDDGACAAEE